MTTSSQKITEPIAKFIQQTRQINAHLHIAQEMLVKSTADIANAIDLRNYGQTFRLTDNLGNPKTPEEAKQIITEAFYDLITSAPNGQVSTYVNSYLSHGRTDFRLAVGLDKTGGNHRLYPVCKWEAITGQAFEFTARVQALGGFTHPPREAQEANQPAVPAQATPEQYDAALARASAAGYLMTHSVCFIESKGYRVTNWQAGYNFQVKGANGVNAALIYEAIGLFTHITGADSAQQNAVQQRSRSYSLTKRSDIQELFTNLGIGETFEDRCQQMFDYQQEHKGNIQPMKIDVDLNALLPSVKSFICDNPQRIQNFLQNNQGYTEETAKAELEAAFQLGTEGNLW